MFYLIGLGLGDVTDITVKGLEVVKNCSRVYLEAYTSILISDNVETLEKYYGKKIILADRDTVEQDSDSLFEGCDKEDVAFLVVGDPFGATTHTDLVLRTIQKQLPYKVIHNASIMNAIGCCGLQLYNFGETVSMVFWTDTWKPESFYDKICSNLKHGKHTLCLLDIKMKEQTIENLMKGRKIFEPPRFMSVSLACEQLMEIVQRREEAGEECVLKADSICVGVARVGSDSQQIKTATLEELAKVNLGDPLHSLVIAGTTHPIEREMLSYFAVNDKIKLILKSME